MADVRAMLRSEMASRNADQHTSKKRKAAPEPTQPESKKARSEASQPGTAPDISAEPQQKSLQTVDSPVSETEPDVAIQNNNKLSSTPVDVSQNTAAVQPQVAADIDEDEWAAFERDVATPPPEDEPSATMPGQTHLSVFNAPATISARPLSAEELAAQAREQESTQKRGRKELELEEEREEAQVALEEEFEEMEGLEERVRRLREKREAIRRASDSRPGADGVETGAELDAVLEEREREESGEEGSDSGDDDDDDEWNLWRK